MKKIHNGLVYDTDNPKYIRVAEYKSGDDEHIIYRVTQPLPPTNEKWCNYISYTKKTRITDSPQPPAEEMYIYTEKDIEKVLNTFRGTVHWEKFEEA